jgi:hypothetical protein
MKKSAQLLSLILGSFILFGLVRAETVTPSSVANDPLGPRYESTLAEGVDFTKRGYPGFLNKVTGISGYEAWGRWTDGKEAKFQFKQKLPNKFVLELTMGAFGPNVNVPAVIQVGKVSKKLVPTDGNAKAYSVNFEGVNSDTLTILPGKPTSPKSLNISPDERVLGLGLVSLKIK